MNPGQPIVTTLGARIRSVWSGKIIPAFTKKDIFSRAKHNEVLAATNAFLNPQIIRGTADKIDISDAGWTLQINGSAGSGSGGLNYRGAYSAGTDYAVNDVVYTAPDANNLRVPWVCEIANGPSTAVHAPTWPEPGTVYWRDVARFFFSPASSQFYRVGLDGPVYCFDYDGTTGDLWAVGQYGVLSLTDSTPTTTTHHRNGVCTFNSTLNARHSQWCLEFDGNTIGNQGYNGINYAITQDGAGSAFIGGQFYRINSYIAGNNVPINQPGLAKLRHDGYCDEGFADAFFDNDITSIVLDGSVQPIAGGYFTTINGLAHQYLAKLDAAGGIVGGFAPSVPASNFVQCLLWVSGNVYVGMDQGSTSAGVMLVNGITGATIGSFSTGTGITWAAGSPSPAQVFALAWDGSFLYIGGVFDTYNGTAVGYLIRVNSSGTLDGSFTPTFNGVVREIFIQSNGKILVGGNFTTVIGVIRYGICRLNSGGTLDTGFNASLNAGATVFSIYQNATNTFIGGNFTSPRNYILRADLNGVVQGP